MHHNTLIGLYHVEVNIYLYLQQTQVKQQQNKKKVSSSLPRQVKTGVPFFNILLMVIFTKMSTSSHPTTTHVMLHDIAEVFQISQNRATLQDR